MFETNEISKSSNAVPASAFLADPVESAHAPPTVDKAGIDHALDHTVPPLSVPEAMAAPTGAGIPFQQTPDVKIGMSGSSSSSDEKKGLGGDGDRTLRSPSSSASEKGATSGEETEKGGLSGGEFSEKGRESASGGSETERAEEEEEEDPELAGLDPEVRRKIKEQVDARGVAVGAGGGGGGKKGKKGKKAAERNAGFVDLYRFHTRFEIFLNVIGLACSIISGAAQPLMTIIFGNLTTSFVGYASATMNGDPAVLQAAQNDLFDSVDTDALYLLYIGIGMFVATFIYMVIWIYTGEAATKRYREAYLRSVLRQNIAYFDKMGPGEVTTRISTDTHLIQEGISDKVPISISFISTFVSAFVIAYIRNWRLALVLTTIIPCIAVAGAIGGRFVARFQKKALGQVAEGGTLAEEVISSVRNTHAFGTQKKLVALYDAPNQKAAAYGLKANISQTIMLGVMFFTIYAAYALAFYYGTTLLLDGLIAPGVIVNVFLAILIGAFSLAQIPPNSQAMSVGLGAASKILETIERIPPIDSADEGGLRPEKVEGVITVENVDFWYPARPNVQVLKNFSAQFPQGKTTALVGASGSGKSTIIQLLERFYDPMGGVVKLDGVDIKTLNVKWLRTQIGLVSQEPTLFATTIWGNVGHGLIGTQYENADEETKKDLVVEACKKANADSFITALPEGYDTLIGERGMLLSGGQKQRIAIARAIVSDPRILLLDEATSALDTASEVVVQAALDAASAGRTTITIAHRLSTIRDAAQIIVMTGGRIVEVGTHAELLKKPDGAYQRLVSAQRFREATEGEKAEAEEYTAEEERATERAILEKAALVRRQSSGSTKAEMPDLHRANTGVSAASEAIEKRKQKDLELGITHEPVKHSMAYLFYRMGQLNKKEAPFYVIGVIGSAVMGMLYPVFAIIFASVIQAFSSPDRGYVRHEGNLNALYFFILSLAAFFGTMAQQLAFGRGAERLSRIIRLKCFEATLRQDISFFDETKHSTGILTAAIADHAQKINGLAGVTLGTIIQSIVTLIGGPITGLCYAPKLSAVGIACIPLNLSAGLTRLRVVVLRDVKTKAAHEYSSQLACEAAAAIRTVASLTREKDCERIYSEALEKPLKDSHKTAILGNALYALSNGITFWVIALAFWYGSRLLVNDGLTTKGFYIGLMAVVFASLQTGNIFNFVPDVSKAKGAANDAINLFDSVPEIDSQSSEGEKVTDCVGRVRFEDVHFRYPTRQHVRVLRGLNIEVKPGQFVALVGPSGCGKSTIVQLTERFYDPVLGKVTVDGKDISEMNIQNYRSHISLVSQEPTLYSGTVRFNILLGATKPAELISQEELERACKDANIHDFIMSLPDGYDTEVGGKGSQLSGGQKQRIAIARALVRNPRILLLDEATSALDSESEKVVQTALDQASKGRSTIAVAHRLSTIQNADVIYVLREGRVAEKGKHAELLAKKGIYYELVNQQELERNR